MVLLAQRTSHSAGAFLGPLSFGRLRRTWTTLTNLSDDHNTGYFTRPGDADVLSGHGMGWDGWVMRVLVFLFLWFFERWALLWWAWQGRAAGI